MSLTYCERTIRASRPEPWRSVAHNKGKIVWSAGPAKTSRNSASRISDGERERALYQYVITLAKILRALPVCGV